MSLDIILKYFPDITNEQKEQFQNFPLHNKILESKLPARDAKVKL